MWESEKIKVQNEILLDNRPVVLGGDGRCDLMGHTAKSDTYTLIELDANKCWRKVSTVIYILMR